MPSRQIKSLPTPGHGYPHREHRSKKAIKGLNTRLKRERRLIRLNKEEKKEEKIKRRIKQLVRK